MRPAYPASSSATSGAVVGSTGRLVSRWRAARWLPRPFEGCERPGVGVAPMVLENYSRSPTVQSLVETPGGPGVAPVPSVGGHLGLSLIHISEPTRRTPIS